MKIGANRIFSLVLGASLSLGTAWADLSIPISNPSFETAPGGGYPLTAGCGTVSGCQYDLGEVPGWNSTGTSNSGQWQPGILGGPPDFFNSLPNGTTILFTSGDTVYQTVTATESGVVTLGVYVGDRSDGFGTTSYLSDVDMLINHKSYLASGSDPTSGNWSLWTVSADVTAGETITIMLSDVNGGQADYDDVSLGLNPTPEPSFYGVLALGLVGLGFAVKRRRASNQSSTPSV